MFKSALRLRLIISTRQRNQHHLHPTQPNCHQVIAFAPHRRFAVKPPTEPANDGPQPQRQQQQHIMNRRKMFRNFQQQQQQQQPPRSWDHCAGTDDADDTDAATAAADPAQPHINITVMSYNVLAQHLLNIHPELYAAHLPRHLDWPHRFQRLIAHVRQVQPDVLCLQEVQRDHLPEFVRALRDIARLDAHVYKKRTADTYRDGCAIFYRSSALGLRAAHRVEYLQPAAPQLLDRPNVAVLAHFYALDRPLVQFVVATTHLLYNPRREDVRLAQVQVLLAELDRCAYLGRDAETSGPVHAPVILTGDFNSPPTSATVALLTQGCVQYAHRLGTRMELSSDGGGRSGAYGEQLLPVQLGITDACQHGAMALWPRVSHPEDMRATWLHNSQTNQILDQPDVNSILATGLPYQTGTLRHALGLRSVYERNGQHNTSPSSAKASGGNSSNSANNGAASNANKSPKYKQPETATTFHDAWITVDYMLYSRPFCWRRKRHVESDALRLLQRLRLPTVGECQQRMGRIPNAELGSDHVSLAARFRVGESQWLKSPTDE